MKIAVVIAEPLPPFSSNPPLIAYNVEVFDTVNWEVRISDFKRKHIMLVILAATISISITIIVIAFKFTT